MILATTPTVAGKRIVLTHGLVRGNAVRARHIGSDIGAAFKTLVGGEIGAYAKLLQESREIALERLIDDAQSLGANAVVSLRITTSTVMAGAAEILAYGTAVTVDEEAA